MIATLVIALSAAGFFLSTGLGTLWPLAWLAPIPVLLFSFHRSWRISAVVAFLAFFVGGFTILRLFRVGGLIVFVTPPAIAFTLAVLMARAAVSRLPAWLATFAFPAAYTAYEFLYGSVSANGTYWSLGYSQTDLLLLLQVVSLTGLWGVIFVLTFVPSAIAMTWHTRSRAPLAIALVMLLGVVGFGAVRMSATNTWSVRVGVIALDSAGGSAVEIAQAYADRIRAMRSDLVEIAIVPEKVIVASPSEEEAPLKSFRDAARDARTWVVFGLNRTTTPQHNVAVVIGPGGHLLAEYEKHHLVPLIETGFTPGSTPRIFPGPRHQWGVEICKDLDFPAWSREYGRRGVRLLAVPALDFIRDGRMHARMAVVRGVENGFAVARAAGQGRVTLSDAYGRVLAERESAADGRAIEQLPAGPGATIYTRFGDWFGWVTVVLVAALLVALSFRRRASLSPRPHDLAEL